MAEYPLRPVSELPTADYMNHPIEAESTKSTKSTISNEQSRKQQKNYSTKMITQLRQQMEKIDTNISRIENYIQEIQREKNRKATPLLRRGFRFRIRNPKPLQNAIQSAVSYAELYKKEHKSINHKLSALQTGLSETQGKKRFIQKRINNHQKILKQQ